MPANTVKVDRTTPFGNPFPIGESRAASVAAFRKWVSSTAKGKALARRATAELRGKNLACWCPLDGPCHAEILLAIANAVELPPRSMKNAAARARKKDTTIHQTLDEVFRYELSKRSNDAGIARAALSGDRETLKTFASLAAFCVESASELPEIRDRLLRVLNNIEAGSEPNEAFGYARGRGGRPTLQTNFAELSKSWLIGQRIAGLLANDPNRSDASAYKSVAREYNVTVEKARTCREKWLGIRPVFETPVKKR